MGAVTRDKIRGRTKKCSSSTVQLLLQLEVSNFQSSSTEHWKIRCLCLSITINKSLVLGLGQFIGSFESY